MMPAAEEIARAAERLRAGELIGLPTETVYGLAADARNPVAVAKIFAAKGRPSDHPLIVHLADVSQLSDWARDIPPLAVALAEAFWPGPLTLILKRAKGVPDAVTGGQDTVGVRLPAHPVAQAVLRAFGSGLAAPSANRFGRISPTTAAHVREELGDKVSLVLDGGPCKVGIESTILDLSGDTLRILRPGAVSADDIAAVIGQQPTADGAKPDKAGQAVVPRVSGSLAAHYAPLTPLQLVATEQLQKVVADHLARGHKVAVLARQPAPAALAASCVWRMAPDAAADYARTLYANLRELDALGCDSIVLESPPSLAAWSAVRDRLGRAAVGSGNQSA
jgi:L-threonylcarbamoyladenylate synthase